MCYSDTNNCPRSSVSTVSTIKYPQSESDRLQLTSFHHSRKRPPTNVMPASLLCNWVKSDEQQSLVLTNFTFLLQSTPCPVVNDAIPARAMLADSVRLSWGRAGPLDHWRTLSTLSLSGHWGHSVSPPWWRNIISGESGERWRPLSQ